MTMRNAMRDAMRDGWEAWAGHAWTVGPSIRDRIRPIRAPDGVVWETTLVDPELGEVRLRGVLREEPEASTLLLVVHGLGGDPASPYCRRAAQRAAARGWSCLRLGMRGSSGDGEDLYHAGLDRDLAHALEDPRLRRYDRVVVLGYSLGGHLALRYGLRPSARVTAVAAVGAPLDLDRSCRAIDRRRAWPYRAYVLSALRQSYRAVAARRPLATSLEEIARVRTLRDWDRRAVVPRFGFADVDDYYRRASVGPRLSALQVPALYLGMRHDPMVVRAAVEPSLAAATPGRLETRWQLRGGHVAGPGTWEDEALDWLDRARR